jgi:casein kinase I family protein HRR25
LNALNAYIGTTPPFDANNPRRMTAAMGSGAAAGGGGGAPLPSANLRSPYRAETKSPETSKRLDDVMLQYQQQQKMLQHKPTYFSGGTILTNNNQQPQQQMTSPTSYQDPYASHLGYTGTGGGRMLVRDNHPQQQQQQLGGKYERKRVLADEPNPIEPSIADPLFSVKRTHFHPQPPPQTTTNTANSRV